MHRSAKLFMLDNMFAMAAFWVCSGTVVAAMTNYYNIPIGIANILTGITATLTLLQMLGGVLFSRAMNKNLFLKVTNFTWRLMLPLVFFSVLLPMQAGAILFTISLVLMVAFFQISAAAQNAWMLKSVEGHGGPAYFSAREMSFMVVNMTLFLIAALIIDASGRGGWEREGFLSVGILECSAIVVSLLIFMRLPGYISSRQNGSSPKAHNPTQKNKEPLGKMIAPIIQNKPFMRVVVTNVLWSFSNMFIGGFSAIYQVRMLNLPFSQILIWTTVGSIFRIIAAPVFQRLALRISWQRVVQISVGMVMCAGILWLFVNEHNWSILYPIIAIINSIPFAGMGIGFLQLQVEGMGDVPDRTVYFSFIATLNGVVSMLGSFLCSLIITTIEVYSPPGEADLRPVFYVGIVFIVVTICFAQFIGQHKNIRKNKLKDAINAARQKYPHAIGEPVPTKKKLRRFFKRK